VAAVQSWRPVEDLIQAPRPLDSRTEVDAVVVSTDNALT
jgi:hypothetical protein